MRRARLWRWAGMLAAIGMAGLALVFVLWPAPDDEPVAREGKSTVVQRKRHATPRIGRRAAPELPTPSGEPPPSVRVSDLDADVELDSDDPVAEAPPEVEVTGLVIDTEGRPVREAWVHLQAGGPDGEANRYRLRVDDDATFATWVSPGALSLRAYREDGGIAYPSDVVDLVTEPAEQIEVTLVLPAERVGGLGVSFELADGGAHILHVIPGTPAEAMGLSEGDVVLAVDGVEVADLDQDDFVARLAGPEGSVVDVTVRIGEAVEDHAIVRTYLMNDEDGNPYGDPVPGLDLVDPRADTGAGFDPDPTGKAPMLGLDTAAWSDTGG